MISNVTFSYFVLFCFVSFNVVTVRDTDQNFKTSERLLDTEFIIIKRVKLLFHLFLKPPPVIKQINYYIRTLLKMSLRPCKLFQ